MLRFSKSHCSHGFHPISTKVYGKHGNQGGIQVINFSGDLPKIKHFMAPWNCCNHRTIWGWKFQSATHPTVFIQCQSNFMRTLATMGEYRLLLFLAIGQIKKKIVALWNFNMGVNGKIMKCAIPWKWPTMERNGWKFGTRSLRNSLCRVLFRSGHSSSLWGHSVHFAKFPMLRLSKGCRSYSFHPISTKLYGKHGNQGGMQVITFFGDLPKIKNFMALWISC